MIRRDVPPLCRCSNWGVTVNCAVRMSFLATPNLVKVSNARARGVVRAKCFRRGDRARDDAREHVDPIGGRGHTARTMDRNQALVWLVSRSGDRDTYEPTNRGDQHTSTGEL